MFGYRGFYITETSFTTLKPVASTVNGNDIANGNDLMQAHRTEGVAQH